MDFAYDWTFHSPYGVLVALFRHTSIVGARF